MRLILYFSAENGTTAKIARDLADYLRGQRDDVSIVEIKPEIPYTKADLRYLNPLARCNKEKFTGKNVPVSEETMARITGDWEKYDTVFLGFPIWYGAAPNVINSFCEGLDWTGKKVFAFATSKMSGIGKTAEKLRPFLKGAELVNAWRVQSADELAQKISV
ncbi:MAG: NAD(P)H-dependent oxidoreductase [Synergistaceae bacterium]|nr:NAD(P)H-dependent oxidoreductase [Synergistaceae bacterium]